VVDARFFPARGPFALGALAALAEARLIGDDPMQPIAEVAPLEDAGPDQITFLDHARYRDQARATRAAACLVRPAHAGHLPDRVARLLSERPYHGYARIAAAFHPDAAARARRVRLGPASIRRPRSMRRRCSARAARSGPVR
jgi:UDP-3-O-[3-hydroxymyristoyl] glucosamine N-acyltransferase